MSGTALTNMAPTALPFLQSGVASAAVRAHADGANTAAFAGVALLALVAPFERIEPLVRLPGQSISNLEAALAGACAAWLCALIWTRRMPKWRTLLTGPWLLVAAALAAAVGV